MKVTYLEHSGFYLELPGVDLLFDYYKGELPPRQTNKPLLVFVSHRHHDHYCPALYADFGRFPHTSYILSDDIPEDGFTKKSAKDIIRIGPNAQKRLTVPGAGEMEVETLRSTDEGVAFLLNIGGLTIYHAGDLNRWVWDGEPEEDNEAMKEAFSSQMNKLRNQDIDIAFVPLDPRQEQYAFDGMREFLEAANARHVFPMHFWGEYSIIEAAMVRYPDWKNTVIPITTAPEQFVIEDNHL